MKYFMQLTVPRCSECSSLMYLSPHGDIMYYVCNDCNKVYRVIGNGKLDGEICVSDNATDEAE